MSDKGGDGPSKALTAVAAFGAAFVARKVATMAWTKVTGHEPPADPEDPAVGMAEALGWAVAMGVVVGAVRVLAIRAVGGREGDEGKEGPFR
jgi:hypothetical protein